MKAVTFTQYGDPEVLQLREVEKPTVSDNEVLIRIRATAATMGDCEIRRFHFGAWPIFFWLPLRVYMGITKPWKPVIPGAYFSGEIESVGRGVNQFREGDKVFAASGMRFSTYAEYICLPAKYPISLKPANMTFEEAAGVPLGGLNALHFIRKGKIRSGERVLVNGAGGSIGTYAVQLARSLGAEITAVDKAGKLDMLRSIGATHVIDYHHEDFTKGGQTYDVILDVVRKSSFSRSVRSLTRNGRYLLANPGESAMVRALWTSMLTGRKSGKKVFFEFATESSEDLIHLRELIEAGDLKAVIDRKYKMSQTVEAHRYIESGQKKGDVVLSP